MFRSWVVNSVWQGESIVLNRRISAIVDERLGSHFRMRNVTGFSGFGNLSPYSDNEELYFPELVVQNMDGLRNFSGLENSTFSGIHIFVRTAWCHFSPFSNASKIQDCHGLHDVSGLNMTDNINSIFLDQLPSLASFRLSGVHTVAEDITFSVSL